MVDRLSIGVLEMSESSTRLRLGDAIQQLKLAISRGLNITVGVDSNGCIVGSIVEQTYENSDYREDRNGSDPEASDDENPQAPLTLSSHCYSPNITDCAWYSECLALRLPCHNHQAKYSIRYGAKFCELFSSSSISINRNSFAWIDHVRQCVQRSFDPLLHRCNSEPSCDEIQTASIRSYQSCFSSPSDVQSVCTVIVGDWYRIFWTVKASLTTDYAAVSRNMLSSCLRCGGAYSQQLGRSFYSIMGRRKTAAKKRSAEEPMTDDELAHAVVKLISQQLNWHNETTVDWYAFAADESQPSGTVQIQVPYYEMPVLAKT